ncbi:MAG: hypothetical protein BWK78_05155 [Thiotrichaceae bacterium IS1]|nr:MAG: hypothetical protein BWK78_05155 [Thiotrichaceae bacterium IS1]
MNLSNPLPATWQAILCVRDALKITRRVLIHSPSRLPEESSELLRTFQQKLRAKTLYEVEKALPLLEEIEGRSSQAIQEVEGFLVLGLWAAFERFLRDYLQEKGTVLQQHIQPSAFANSLYNHFSKNVERWEPREILDFLKDSLLTTPTQQKQVNKAQQILTYRNWVAHANPNRFHGREELQTTFSTLNDIINILLQY